MPRFPVKQAFKLSTQFAKGLKSMASSSAEKRLAGKEVYLPDLKRHVKVKRIVVGEGDERFIIDPENFAFSRNTKQIRDLAATHGGETSILAKEAEIAKTGKTHYYRREVDPTEYAQLATDRKIAMGEHFFSAREVRNAVAKLNVAAREAGDNIRYVGIEQGGFYVARPEPQAMRLVDEGKARLIK